MENNHLERGSEELEVVEDVEEKESYRHYQELGGNINEDDYKNALEKAETMPTVNKFRIKEAEEIARFSEIELRSTKEALDRKIILYGILREDIPPEGFKHPNSQSDQIIFAEALRMLEDISSLNKMIKFYPHISFDYQEGEKQEKQEKQPEPEQEYKAAA